MYFSNIFLMYNYLILDNLFIALLIKHLKKLELHKISSLNKFKTRSRQSVSLVMKTISRQYHDYYQKIISLIIIDF